MYVSDRFNLSRRTSLFPVSRISDKYGCFKCKYVIINVYEPDQTECLQLKGKMLKLLRLYVKSYLLVFIRKSLSIIFIEVIAFILLSKILIMDISTNFQYH